MESIETFFEDSYKMIRYEESLELSDCRHVAHCLIYALNSLPVVDSKKPKAFISMHMRFDGCLGFPGGFIDKNERTDIVSGLNRELVEEINLNKKFLVTEEHHCFSCINKERSRCFHFFTREVSLDDFQEMEKDALNAKDALNGTEVLGLIRVPLLTKKDGIRGFPMFLSNCFAGCSKYQLLYFLQDRHLMSYDDIKECLLKSLTVTEVNSI